MAWVASRAAIGAALAGLVALGPQGALAGGMTTTGDSPRAKATASPPAKAAKGGKRSYDRSAPKAYKTCGQFKYRKDGRCLDARITPPSLK
jgi:hypothetical protein